MNMTESTSNAASMRLALNRDDTVLLVIDIQERLGAAMEPARFERLVKNTGILIQTAKTLGLPVLVTEQYPRGLGHTVPALLELLPEDATPVEKVAFSCGAVKELARRLFDLRRKQVIVVGMETHVCVFQTVRDLVAGGYAPFVARDAVLSRTTENHDTGLELMRESGATISSTETIVFDLLGAAGTPEFKALSPLVK